MNSNIVLMKSMIANGYADMPARWAAASRPWKRGWPSRNCWKADADAEYAAVIDIDLADVKEPIVCLPERSGRREVAVRSAGAKIDEVFIGSCMTNIGHFRAAGEAARRQERHPDPLWIAPPTKMDAPILTKEGSLRRPRRGRRAHGNAGLLAVHGQPGAGAARAARRCRPRPATSPTV
jgi:aconitate hydratase 2/2-methylisocitrate dehydratase